MGNKNSSKSRNNKKDPEIQVGGEKTDQNQEIDKSGENGQETKQKQQVRLER